MGKLRKDLEVLRSWGIESVPVDKVLSMIDELEEDEDGITGEDCTEAVHPPCIKEDGVDKYFREIPMYVNSGKPYPLYNEVYRTSGVGVPEPDAWIY